jgi:hypothetical protein
LIKAFSEILNQTTIGNICLTSSYKNLEKSSKLPVGTESPYTNLIQISVHVKATVSIASHLESINAKSFLDISINVLLGSALTDGIIFSIHFVIHLRTHKNAIVFTISPELYDSFISLKVEAFSN